jgi:hypothetical protein
MTAETTSEESNYTEQVRRLFQARRCVESSFSPVDQKLAADCFRGELVSIRSKRPSCLGALEST